MRSKATVLTAATAAVTAAVLAWAAPAQAGSLVVLSEGHVDVVDVAYEAGEFEVGVHSEAGEHEPADVLFVAKPEAATTVPDDSRYAFLGRPGATVHILPEFPTENLLFPGLAAEEVEPGVFAGDAVTIRFKKVYGPDGVSLFATDPAGDPVVLVDSEDGLPDSVTLSAGTHIHQNWAFERPGRYAIKVDVTGTLAGTGAVVTSEPVWLKFTVER